MRQAAMAFGVGSMLVLGGCAYFDFDQTEPTEVPPAPVEAQTSESLAGKWTLDLRPTPDAEAYFRTMVIESVKDGTLTGSFYGSEMKRGKANDDWAVDGDVVFSFVTEDGSGPYHTSGILRGGRLVGVTHSLGRGFVSRWTAEREADGD